MDCELLESLAQDVGTPFWVYEASVLQRQISAVKELTAAEGIQARYAIKACSATRILQEMIGHGLWVDAVSGNEILRALRVGYPGGQHPPKVLFTCDVFRLNSLQVLLEHDILPNLGSPGMLSELDAAGYRGPVSIRVNPGFGHGHVDACDTAGPSSKHGIWFEDLSELKRRADSLGIEITMLHAHIGSGPKNEELLGNFRLLVEEFSKLLPIFPQVSTVNLGGGLPYNYRKRDRQLEVAPLKTLLEMARQQFCEVAGREIRLEIEPGRYLVAPVGTLVARVKEIKQTRTNGKGKGVHFAMVDAGFNDLIRPLLYGAYHAIEICGRASDEPNSDIAVAGPLCESGDIFTQSLGEIIELRKMPLPKAGELLLIRDAGAYGYVMNMNYNSLGRAPQLFLEDDGSVEMFSRRETIEDILQIETRETLRTPKINGHF